MWSAICIRVNTSSLDFAVTWWWWWKRYVRCPRRLRFFWLFLQSLLHIRGAGTHVRKHICSTALVWCGAIIATVVSCINTGIVMYGNIDGLLKPQRSSLLNSQRPFIALISVPCVGLCNFLFPSCSTAECFDIGYIKCMWLHVLHPSSVLFHRLHWGDEGAGKHSKTRNPRVR